MKNLGTIIPLAWPNTPVIQEGKWYDGIMRILGFIKNGYYKAGHAALVLANHETKEFYYYDFGRYQTPKKHGRVRDSFTDPDLILQTKVELEDGKITNIEALMSELASLEATHGEGRLIASTKVVLDIDKAFAKAKAIQNREAIIYGPFNIGGTNCSRFVAQTAKTSNLGWFKNLIIRFPYTITHTTITNVKIINDKRYYYELKNGVFTKRMNILYPLIKK
jgi:hypothetical protein